MGKTRALFFILFIIKKIEFLQIVNGITARIWDCVKNERLRLNSAIKQGNKKIRFELN
jgi:hypothetical protein